MGHLPSLCLGADNRTWLHYSQRPFPPPKALRIFADFAAKKGRLRRSIGERASCPAGVPLHIGSSAGLEARAPAEKPSVTNIANSFAMYVP